MSRGGYDWMTDYVEAERQKKWEEQRKSMEAESSSTVDKCGRDRVSRPPTTSTLPYVWT